MRFVKAALAVGSALIVAAGSVPAVLADAAHPQAGTAGTAAVTASTAADTAVPAYRDYLAAHPQQDTVSATVRIEAESAAPGQTDKTVTGGRYSGGAALIAAADGAPCWQIEVPQTGHYVLRIGYYTKADRNDTPIRRITVDGALPFTEAASIAFSRSYTDDGTDGAFRRDASGNELTPEQVQEDRFMLAPLRDPSGYNTGDLLLWLTAGVHTIGMAGVSGELTVDYLELSGAAAAAPYEDYLQAHGYTGALSDAALTTVEAEHPVRRSAFSIAPAFDRTSANTSPQSLRALRLNKIGGDNWKTVGQTLTWAVSVPQDGFYRLGARYRQDTLDGAFVSRSLYIDGELPYAEAAELTFSYSADWQTAWFGGDKVFYLTAGQHELTLEVTLGKMADILYRVKGILSDLNAVSRAILHITGTQPDLYRDYNFPDLIPDEIAQMAELARQIEEQKQALLQLSGTSGEKIAVLERLCSELTAMNEKPQSIAERYSTFKDDLSALGDWMSTLAAQPLELDCLYIGGAAAELPRAEAGFFASLWYNIRLVVMSFVVDYDSVGTAGTDTGSALRVWIATGRDQAQTLRELAVNDFTPAEGIPVQVELVSSAALMPAALSGQGPDVALSNEQTVPVNFSLRHAVLPLDGFDGIGEVLGRFYESAAAPFYYRGALYALPETQSFPMLFYRTDILEEFGLSVPQTWDEFYSLVSSIKKHGMDVGMTGGAAGFYLLFFQRGGVLYNDLGTKALLSSDEAIGAFNELCDCFTLYKLPIAFDFVNRFRSGEMPVAIYDYTVCNQLSVFAPEIAGLWKMAPIPKTAGGSGDAVSTVTGAMILSGTEKPDEAWRFLRWWTSADVQARYCNRMESLLGVAGKQATANREALSMLTWDAENYRAITAQMGQTVGLPMVPGSYIVTRELEFAFTNVYNRGSSPTLVLEDKIPVIDRELMRKYQEFEGQG